MRNLMTEILSSEIALPLASVFETLAIARATHYRHQANPLAADQALELRDHIQIIALEWPQYGYRRITAELHRQGVEANHRSACCA